MNMKRKFLNAAVLSALGVAGTAGAVNIGDDGLGQVLIYPYYTAQNGNATIFTVVNTTQNAKAVKVRVLEGKNSREVIDFNLYLSANDVWTGAIDATADGAKLSTTDASCTVPAISVSQGGTGSVEFRNYEFTGTNADGETDALSRTREGYIEILEMGVLGRDYITNGAGTGTIWDDAAVTHVNGVPRDCAAIVKAWEGGGDYATSNATLWDPSGGLMGTGTIINVAMGTDYSYDPVVLDEWSNNDNHTEPGSLDPALSDALAPYSIVFYNGVAVSSNWSNTTGGGADAVSALFMRDTVLNEYTIEPTLAAGTDWIINFPTKKFYVDPDIDTDADSADKNFSRPFSQDFKANGACENVALRVFDREEKTTSSGLDFSPKPPGSVNSLCWEVTVVTFNSSDVLGAQNKLNVNVPYNNGWLRMTFGRNGISPLAGGPANTTDGAGELTRQIVSDELDTYYGLPVIGFAVQEYVNGNLNGALSNYGGAFVHKYEREVDYIAP